MVLYHPVCRKKIGKLAHLGPVCRIRQTGIRQTGPNSGFVIIAVILDQSENFMFPRGCNVLPPYCYPVELD